MKHIMGLLKLERNTPELRLKPELNSLIHPVDTLKGTFFVCLDSFCFNLDFYKPELHGHLSNLTCGVRSVVDSKGNFVTSRKEEAEETEPILEGSVGEIQPIFEHVTLDSDEELDIDKLIDFFADDD